MRFERTGDGNSSSKESQGHNLDEKAKSASRPSNGDLHVHAPLEELTLMLKHTKITSVTDSKSVNDGITKLTLKSTRNGWKTAKGKQAKHQKV
jgi:ribonuclease HI